MYSLFSSYKEVSMIYACIGDVHGRGSELHKCLEHIESMRSCTSTPIKTVLLGDYCDRGNENKLTLDLIIDHKNKYPDSIVLFGNHEELFLGSFLLRYLDKHSFLRMYHKCSNTLFDTWTSQNNGGSLTFWEFEPLIKEANKNHPNGYDPFAPYLQFIRSLPDRVKEGNFLFTHAPINQSTLKQYGYHVERLPSGHVLWNMFQTPTTRKFWNIHGHIHRWEENKPEFNCSCKSINCHTSPSLTVSYIDDSLPIDKCLVDWFSSIVAS